MLKELGVRGLGVAHNLGGQAELLAAWRAGQRPALSGPLPEPDLSELASLLPGAALRRVPTYCRLALLAGLRALKAAGPQPVAPERTALVVGSAFGAVKTALDFMESIQDFGPQLASPTAFSHSVNNVAAGMLSQFLGLRGPCCTVNQFGLSFSGALFTAFTLLGSGQAEAALVGAVDEWDPRFCQCCASVLGRGDLAWGQGAVFLYLRADGAASLRLAPPTWGGPPAEADLVFASPAWPETLARPYWQAAGLYGFTPLAQALDVALALGLLAAGPAEAGAPPPARAACLYADPHSGRRAAVNLWRS